MFKVRIVIIDKENILNTKSKLWGSESKKNEIFKRQIMRNKVKTYQKYSVKSIINKNTLGIILRW